MDVFSARSIEKIVTSVRVLEGGGFPVRRPIPNPEMDQIDPFLLLDHLGRPNGDHEKLLVLLIIHIEVLKQ